MNKRTLCGISMQCVFSERCLPDTTRGSYGEYDWPGIFHSTQASLPCVYGPADDHVVEEGGIPLLANERSETPIRRSVRTNRDTDAVALRWCNVSGAAVLWREPDYTQCYEVF